MAIGGSDAGIQAALRARELDSSAGVTVVQADAYPNYSICGIPYYVSGDVPDWHNLPTELSPRLLGLTVTATAPGPNTVRCPLANTNRSGAGLSRVAGWA